LDAPSSPLKLLSRRHLSPAWDEMLARFKMAHSKTSLESFHNRYVLSESSAGLFHLPSAGVQKSSNEFKAGKGPFKRESG